MTLKLFLRQQLSGPDYYKCLVAAKLSKTPIQIVKEDRDSFQLKDENERLTIQDPTAIAIHVSSNQFARKDDEALYAQVLQWMNLAVSELRPFRRVSEAKHAIRVMEGVNQHLRLRTYLVGERLSLADVVMSVEMAPIINRSNDNFQYLRRWFRTVANQPGVKDIVDLELEEKENDSKAVLNVTTKPIRPKKEKATPVAAGRKLRILCLHGYRQNETSFKEKTGAFRKIISKFADLTFFTAPLKVPSIEGEESDPRGWWFSQPCSSFDAHEDSSCDAGFGETLTSLKNVGMEHGPFDGVFAFSQGAALGVLLCLMQQQGKSPLPPFNFALLVAPFKSRSQPHAKWYEGARVAIPTLHVIGDTDKVIEKEMSEASLEYFTDPVVLRHPGGHFVPASSQQKKVYVEFLTKRREEIKE